ncbi:hypothetical protein J421_4677 (plasmid) [Gemmatirosa kalamazoonensis]|uniref:Uncharacterized protein n=1 Tax=Gemmatirosa kalamazoonensis TaxID=861299 RepID=W0RP05_9BACT|nr:hypothetical protein [Gemmatirosa kalamazoonensis]AHG92145.1 hypothetical protein J421_4610 [Gemmatirosa kalamazoonensis]AHG92212.1 hypothetical protein J421_4677 [Gemmatirosa kalamazoonensis]
MTDSPATIISGTDNNAQANTWAGSNVQQGDQAGGTQVEPIVGFFVYETLPPQLRAVGRVYFENAQLIVNTLPRTAERTVALRKLLESRDSAFRALQQR